MYLVFSFHCTICIKLLPFLSKFTFGVGEHANLLAVYLICAGRDNIFSETLTRNFCFQRMYLEIELMQTYCLNKRTFYVP